jgi:hypothetical protein
MTVVVSQCSRTKVRRRRETGLVTTRSGDGQKSIHLEVSHCGFCVDFLF